MPPILDIVQILAINFGLCVASFVLLWALGVAIKDVTFVDALALTLLVLPLVELTVELREDDSVANLLRNHGWQFFAFGLGFVVIARMWDTTRCGGG